MKDFSCLIIVGSQFGDEGKGKIAHLLSRWAHIVVRAQGGANAGHTVVIGSQEFKFHLIPSGILYPHTQAYLTAGMILDIEVLVQEISLLHAHGIDIEGRLKISPRAHVVLPKHKEQDKELELSRGKERIGTTGKGIGPCTADKMLRQGVRLADFNKSDSMFQQLLPYIEEGLEEKLAVALEKGQKVLIEGAQGSWLDINFGTYPYVTSSGTIAGGIIASCGIGPTRVGHTLAVAKAYTTRVGEGPLPTEIDPTLLFSDFAKARELGTTTGRQRRIGWFDVPLTRTALKWNGADSLALMKLDILNNRKTIPLCIAYECNGKRLTTPPTRLEELQSCLPIYEEMPGWAKPIGAIHSFEDLPKEAQNYIQRISELCEVPIRILSYGPGEEETLL